MNLPQIAAWALFALFMSILFAVFKAGGAFLCVGFLIGVFIMSWWHKIEHGYFPGDEPPEPNPAEPERDQ